MGFGGTDAPTVPPESMAFYTFKRAAEDIKELAWQLAATKIILGGHDWGGAIVYRVALWFPALVTHIFAICTPYRAPTRTHILLEKMVETSLPQFRYQIQLASGKVEERIQSKEQVKTFLNALYGGKGPNGEIGFDVRKGALFYNLPKLKNTSLMSEEMLDFYAEQYARKGMHGTLNWYRNREQNFQDELRLDKKIIDIPVLFIQATNDAALPPAMSEGMERYVPNMTRRSVATGHWAQWEEPELVNGMIKEWLEKVDQPRSSL
ncbi:hypothetical protein MMC28_001510 [Mycoblastus sanguinarius]|nr:hypothetical protein [Mycoblastus sanguinarius]